MTTENKFNFPNEFQQRLPAAYRCSEMVNAKNVTIDGEITALDSEGKSSFQLLQSYKSGERSPLVYHAFDLLFLNGTDLRCRPLIERRKLLKDLLKKAPDNIRFSRELRGKREELLQVA